MKTTYVLVRFTFEGIHSWPGAPQDLFESYLALPHRHLFHVQAKRLVSHTERDVEFIELRRRMLEECQNKFAKPHALSCEAMAQHLVETFSLQECEVSEDGENGGLVALSTDNVKAAYLAGILDGDGCIFLHTTQVSYFTVGMSVQMIGPEVPNWILEHFGGKVGEYGNSGGRYTDGRVHTLYHWRLHGSFCEPVLEAVLPYMVLKKRQAQLALGLCALILPRGGHRTLTDREAVLRDRIADELRNANNKAEAVTGE